MHDSWLNLQTSRCWKDKGDITVGQKSSDRCWRGKDSIGEQQEQQKKCQEDRHYMIQSRTLKCSLLYKRGKHDCQSSNCRFQVHTACTRRPGKPSQPRKDYRRSSWWRVPIRDNT